MAQPLHDLNADGNKGVFSIPKRLRLFSDFIPAVLEGLLDGSIDPELPRQVTKTAWLDCIEALAIPHNSNASNGQMFKLADWAGDPLDDDYAEQWIRNEPLVEITQVKDVRALENPTCRWSTWDALRSGVEPGPDLHATLQERAWSSPIWYAP